MTLIRYIKFILFETSEQIRVVFSDFAADIPPQSFYSDGYINVIKDYILLMLKEEEYFVYKSCVEFWRSSQV